MGKKLTESKEQVRASVSLSDILPVLKVLSIDQKYVDINFLYRLYEDIFSLDITKHHITDVKDKHSKKQDNEATLNLIWLKNIIAGILEHTQVFSEKNNIPSEVYVLVIIQILINNLSNDKNMIKDFLTQDNFVSVCDEIITGVNPCNKY